jgi:WD40 repeat protein
MLALSPDGSMLAVGTYDGTIRLWDVQRGEEVLPMRDEHSPILSMAFNPSGTVLAAGSLTASLHLWETEPVAVRLKARRQWLMSHIDPITPRSSAAGILSGR